ncbi:MAG: hypothetical protein ABIH20_06570 [Candidatus Diapherotrites archaeon]
MINELVQLTANSKGTKDGVISLLIEEWPLSGKEIYNRYKKIIGKEISYQGIHKVIMELSQEEIITKEEKGYKLSHNWIKNLKKIAQNIEDKYSENGKTHIIPEKENRTETWFFDNYSEMCTELAQLFTDKKLVQTNPSTGMGVLRHAWWPLEFKFMDFTLLINMMKNNSGGYGIFESDSPFDRWIAKQYKAAGFIGIKAGQKMNLKKDFIIHGDYIVEVNYSEKTKKMLDDVYNNTKDLGDLFKHYAKQEISKTPAEIEVTITKNQELASMIFNQLKEKYFGVDAQ